MNALERRTVVSLVTLYSFRMLGLFMVLPLLALYAVDFPGATPAMVGLALGIYGLSQALLQLPFGWLSDWVGRKPVIIGGLLLLALGSVVAARAESMEMLIVGRCLQGAGAIASAVMALAADLTREEQRTKAMAIIGASIGASFTLAIILGPVVASFGGLEAVFGLTALMAMAGIAIVIWRVPTPPAAPVAHRDVGARLQLIPRSLADRTLMRLNGGVFVLHFILMACFLLVPGYLEAGAGMPREQHWLVYLIALLLSLVAVLPMLRSAERDGRGRQMFILAILVLLPAVAALGLAPAPGLFYCGLFLFFVGFNYLEATLPSLVSKAVFAGGKGTAMGLYSTAQFLGAFAGGALAGWLLQYAGAAALVAACLTLLCLWLLIVWPAGGVPVTRSGEIADT